VAGDPHVLRRAEKDAKRAAANEASSKRLKLIGQA
jgi:hypothetical protein